MISYLEPLMWIWPNSTGLVLIGCKSRSREQNLSFQKAIFKNIIVWNYKAQSFHRWCITSSWGPLPIFGGQHWWLHCDLWLFPQVSDPMSFVPCCLFIIYNFLNDCFKKCWVTALKRTMTFIGGLNQF